MRLLIVSHTPHYCQHQSFSGWGATVREIDHLAILFDQVVHLAPVHSGSPPGSSLAYTAPNVRVRPVTPAGGRTLFAKFGILLRAPAWMAAIREEMQQADVIHVRCPSNISLLALLMLFVRREPRPRWCKYAGNWQPEDHDRISYRLQRWLLRLSGHGAAVTVNGKWPSQPEHVVSFLNPCLTRAECRQGRESLPRKELASPIRLVFVGSLIPGKGADTAIRVLQHLSNESARFSLDIVGDGPQRPTLERLALAEGVADAVEFHGFVTRDALPGFLERAHFLLHPSRSEGFPKVLAEGMAFGTVPLAGAVSGIPQLLRETGVGAAIDPRNEQGFVDAIRQFVRDEDRWKESANRGLEAAEMFTYDAYLDRVIQLFETNFDVSLNHGHPSGVAGP